MTDKDLLQQDPGVIRTKLTGDELKASLNQYMRMLKDAGLATVPKGRGHFDIAFATSEDIAPPILADHEAPKVKMLSTEAEIAREAGATYVAKATPSSSSVEANLTTWAPAKSLAVKRSLVDDGASDDRIPFPASLPSNRRQEELQILGSAVRGCTRCAELSRCRTRVVFGVGNITPRLVFLGEAPGADEDRLGEPFVGAAGQLLNKIIGACKLSRSDVYILNTIKCRPPGNRNPAMDELDNCWEYTERQLEILRPEFICCLGLIATKQLLKTTQPLGQMRQKFHWYRDSRVVVTYHPAYLLRTESAKKYVWEDMKMLMAEMGI